ncbi:hypothetical protein FGO68_gene10200 [Halteria grandinella]|uniref:Cadherin domain-containing protein n=1 Tax=Halteria grandinella TaxID=5974 RepID=A0A8J8P5S5_HALGN|nr:hypothetical protein FGO68_gene10200 [Halteria grandinella]
MYACYHMTSSNDDTIAFQDGPQFYRVRNNYGTSTFSGKTLHDTSAPALMGRGLYCASDSLFYSLMFGTYSGDANRLIMAAANFNTNKITYTRYLYAAGSTINAIVIGAKEFFVVSNALTIDKTTSTSFSAGSFQHGVIYSPLYTCQSLDETSYPEISGGVDAYTFSTETLSYTSVAMTVNIVTITASYTSPVVQAQFEELYVADCVYTPSLAYSSLQSTQSVNAFYFVTADTTRTYSITPFTANKLLGATPNPVFTYQINSFDGPAALTVDSTTGTIFIPVISALTIGTYNLVIEGKTQDCQTVQATFTITGETNVGATFDSIAGYILPDFPTAQGVSEDYLLPYIVDANHAQTYTVSIADGGGLAYPSFVDFTDSTHTKIRVQPSLTTPMGDYTILVNINDGYISTSYSLKITVTAPPPTPSGNNLFAVTNIGPPYFIVPLETLKIEIGKTATFKLPQFIDPDNDKVIVTALLRDAAIFTKFDDKGLQFVFNPTNENAVKPKYQVTIVFTDQNQNSKSIQYPLYLIVNGLQLKNNLASQANQSDLSILEEQVRSKLKLYKCGFKIVRVTRDSKMHLKVTCGLRAASEL